MEILRDESGSKREFRAIIDGKQAGVMTYSMAGADMMIIDHTDVSDDFRGQDVGLKLVSFVVEYARDNNIKIIPLCPFARSVFNKTPEFKDVLKY